MPRVSPFVGLRYDTARAGSLDRLTAPPYDLLPPPALERFLARSEHNIAHLEGGTVPRDEGEYREVAATLASWRRDGVLVETPPTAYALEMTFERDGVRTRTRGILVAMGVEPWGGSVVPHERTGAAPVEDRLRLLRVVRANLSPIHAILPGPSPRLAAALDGVADDPPVAEVADEEGVLHTLRPIALDEDLRAEVAEQRCMIADGHHRYTTALAYREEMRAVSGPGPWDDLLAFLVDAAEEPPVAAFHRIVRRGSLPAPEEPAADLATTLARLDDAVPVVGIARPDGRGGATYGTLRLEAPPPAVVALAPHVPEGEDDVAFTPEAGVADAAVRAGTAVGAWFLPPTTVERIRSVVDRGERLPRKSTYFWPKVRTGLVLRPLD